VLDAILAHYVDGGRSCAEIVAEGFDGDTVRWVIDGGAAERVQEKTGSAWIESHVQSIRQRPEDADSGSL